MGVYDTYEGVQIKIDDVDMRVFGIGDEVALADGIYFGHEGFFVIYDGMLIAKHDAITNKWGNKIRPDSIPMKQRI